MKIFKSNKIKLVIWITSITTAASGTALAILMNTCKQYSFVYTRYPLGIDHSEFKATRTRQTFVNPFSWLFFWFRSFKYLKKKPIFSFLTRNSWTRSLATLPQPRPPPQHCARSMLFIVFLFTRGIPCDNTAFYDRVLARPGLWI